MIEQQSMYRRELEYKQKEFHDRLERELQTIRSLQDMITNRQERIFAKQDQIQSTLHGESIQSPSVFAVSPPLSHHQLPVWQAG